jgi:hypothetical protein
MRSEEPSIAAHGKAVCLGCIATRFKRMRPSLVRSGLCDSHCKASHCSALQQMIVYSSIRQLPDASAHALIFCNAFDFATGLRHLNHLPM